MLASLTFWHSCLYFNKNVTIDNVILFDYMLVQKDFFIFLAFENEKIKFSKLQITMFSKSTKKLSSPLSKPSWFWSVEVVDRLNCRSKQHHILKQSICILLSKNQLREDSCEMSILQKRVFEFSLRLRHYQKNHIQACLSSELTE